MLGMGPTELIAIFVLALVIFGPKRLPEIAKYIGKTINEIKQFTSGVQDVVSKDIIQPINEELIKPITDVKASVNLMDYTTEDSVDSDTSKPGGTKGASVTQ